MPIANDDLYSQSWNTTFGSKPFEDSPSNASENHEDTDYAPIQIPESNPPPSLDIPEVGGGSPVEQSTDHNDQNENEIPHRSSEVDQNTQKNQKDTNNASANDAQKTPENSQKTPLQEERLNTRGENNNLRPNPNPNYSDTYRY